MTPETIEKALLPCPFCGGAADVVNKYGDVTCNNPECAWNYSGECCPERWNTRAALETAGDGWSKLYSGTIAIPIQDKMRQYKTKDGDSLNLIFRRDIDPLLDINDWYEAEDGTLVASSEITHIRTPRGES